MLNTCTSIFEIFYLLTSLFRTQNGLDCIYGNKTKDLTKNCFDELHSTKSDRKNKQVPYQRDSHVTSQTANYANITQTGRIRVYCSWFWVVLVGFVGFVGGFGWFWLVLLVVLGRFGWFWVVPCFSNYQGCYGDIEKKMG